MGARAAIYVRMSTEHQRYSTENQRDELQKYAGEHDLMIVRSYSDDGKSGLSIHGRSGLQQLLHDVSSGAADYTLVLVYDVSRWGRFPDADESAYYEYLCRRGGVQVEYCAEQFKNDGSIGSDIQKVVKRKMVHEYSRALSKNVFKGQSRLIELGFRQGGAAGFGLRRLLMDENGGAKGVLGRGDRKSLQTDRVILVPGPQDEIDTVRWIYRRFIDDDMSEQELANTLNEKGIPTDLGRAWTRGTVHQILINEKYIGNNVWNRWSFKLKVKHVRNPPEMWLRSDAVFEPIVEVSQFNAAHAIIGARGCRLSDDDMLQALQHLLIAQGRLSGLIIDEAEGLPSSSAYQSRFGSLLRAYQLVGFTPERDHRYIEINRTLRLMHPEVVAATVAGIEKCGGTVRREPMTDLLTVNGEITASIVIVRCQTLASGTLRWNVRFDAGLNPDISVVVRMDQPNTAAFDYYLLPKIDMIKSRLRLAQDNGVAFDAYRADSLDAFFDLTARIHVLKVA